MTWLGNAAASTTLAVNLLTIQRVLKTSHIVIKGSKFTGRKIKKVVVSK